MTSKPSESILIIGAGVAGIAAAWTLKMMGYTSLTVLEARGRIGGRVWTSQAWSDTPLDLGASWIHGRRNNPITDLANRAGVALSATDYDNLLLFGSDGLELDATQLTRVDRLERELYRALSRKAPAEGSMQSVIDALLLDRSEAERLLINYLANAAIEHEFAADTTELAPQAFDYGEEFGGADVIFPGGYIRVFAPLLRGIDVRLNHKVTSITYDERGVRVHTNRGVFAADRVILTVPLGVLQQETVEFIPALPREKRAAISALGMGVLNKTYLRFAKTFWPQEPDLIGYVSPTKGEWAEWLNIRHYVDKPILLGFNAGTFGREIESWADQDIVASAMDVLRLLFGNAIPDPDAYQITRWASDPYSFGSYSYPRPDVDTTIEDTIKALGRPIDNRLFFAGEATSIEYPATVHGAFLSGEREAKRIARLHSLS